MKLNYINVITNSPIGTINSVNNLFLGINYSIDIFNMSCDEKGNSHITVGFLLNEKDKLSTIISKVEKLSDVIDVVNMLEYKKQIQYIFNVNCNCKKALKRISKDPDKIIDTEKELVYVFFVKKRELEDFISELNNLRLPFIKRVVGLI